MQMMLPYTTPTVWAVFIEVEGIDRVKLGEARHDEEARLLAVSYLRHEWPGEDIEHHADSLIGFDFVVWWDREVGYE